jgi:hypothetical protein
MVKMFNRATYEQSKTTSTRATSITRESVALPYMVRTVDLDHSAGVE